MERKLASNIPKLYVVKFSFFCHLATGVMVPFLRDWGNLNYAWVMAMQAWFLFSTLLMEVPSGAFADRFGRRNSMVLAGFVGAIGSVVVTASPDLWTLAGGHFLLAVAYALFSGADSALLYDTLSRLDRTDQAPNFWRWVPFCVSSVAAFTLLEVRGQHPKPDDKGMSRLLTAGVRALRRPALRRLVLHYVAPEA